MLCPYVMSPQSALCAMQRVRYNPYAYSTDH